MQIKNPDQVTLTSTSTSGPTYASFTLSAPLWTWDKSGTYSCGITWRWSQRFGGWGSRTEYKYASVTNPNCPCVPSWKTGVTAPDGAVGYTWDASVPSGKLRDATNDAANYWNNIKNLHNGKVWFTSGSKVILKRGPLGGGIAAQTTWQGATIYITLSDSSDYNS